MQATEQELQALAELVDYYRSHQGSLKEGWTTTLAHAVTLQSKLRKDYDARTTESST